ncbi:MAG: hypothetical protein CMC82_01635 [Flavobacteriaceae bacterium]|nr:hypothetical protein [Flavobacteriaceae bacterium]
MSQPDQNSIFYKLGTQTKQTAEKAVTDLKSAASNTFTGSMAIEGATTVGTTQANANLTVNGGTTITGDLTVQGSTTTLSTANLDVKDNFIRLSEGASAGPFTKDQGFFFERGQGNDAASLVWDESEDSFVLGTVASGTAAFLEETIPTAGYSLTFVKGDTSNPNHITSIEFHYNSNTHVVISGVNPIIFDAPAGSDFTDADYQSIKGSFADQDYEYDAGGGNVHTLSVSPGSDDIEEIEHVDENGNPQTIVIYTYHAAVAGGDSTSDTVSATPAAVNVGSLKLGSVNLGNLADFTAGLTT